jgi:hypothetical protein
LSTNSASSAGSAKKGSHGLGVLLEWIYGLSLPVRLQAVMIVYAKHANYWDGTGSRPSIATVAKKAGLKSERRVQQILRELQALGHLVQTEPERQHVPATYRLNVQLPFSANVRKSATSTAQPVDSLCTPSAGVKFSNVRGEIPDRSGVKFSNVRGEIFEHAIRKTVKNRSYTVKNTTTADGGDQSGKSAWGKLHPNLLAKLNAKLEQVKEGRGGRNTYGWTDADLAEDWRDTVYAAALDAGIWEHVAKELAMESYQSRLASRKPVESVTPAKVRTEKA